MGRWWHLESFKEICQEGERRGTLLEPLLSDPHANLVHVDQLRDQLEERLCGNERQKPHEGGQGHSRQVATSRRGTDRPAEVPMVPTATTFFTVLVVTEPSGPTVSI